jgi:hypothetical protein
MEYVYILIIFCDLVANMTRRRMSVNILYKKEVVSKTKSVKTEFKVGFGQTV